MPGPRHTIGLMSSLRRRVAHLLGLLLIVAVPGSAGAQKPVVAAASDLSFALVEISERFTKETGQQVELVFGSSGTLARQVRDGAPFEIFLSADESFVQQLQTAGLTRDGGALYAVGRIVLFAPAGSPMRPDDGLAGLRRVLAAGKVTRFAIANPQHAPYGRAAEAALRKAGLWADLQPKLVLGDNVSQAAQFATTGDAVGGIIAYSLALAPTLTGRGTYALFRDTDHPPYASAWWRSSERDRKRSGSTTTSRVRRRAPSCSASVSCCRSRRDGLVGGACIGSVGVDHGGPVAARGDLGRPRPRPPTLSRQGDRRGRGGDSPDSPADRPRLLPPPPVQSGFGAGRRLPAGHGARPGLFVPGPGPRLRGREHPFVVQPIQRAFESVPADVREAAACCGLTPWQRFVRIEAPLAWPGILTAAILAFAHTLGEFGVVLMVGGNIPGETRTLSIAIYDRMQAFDDRGAAQWPHSCW